MTEPREFGYVESDYARQGIRIFLGEHIADFGRMVIRSGGLEPALVIRNDEDELQPVDTPSIMLNERLARELYAALGRFYGPDGHDNTVALRRDYNAERGRVDKLTDALIENLGIASRR